MAAEKSSYLLGWYAEREMAEGDACRSWSVGLPGDPSWAAGTHHLTWYMGRQKYKRRLYRAALVSYRNVSSISEGEIMYRKN